MCFTLQEQRWSQRICLLCIKVSLHSSLYSPLYRLLKGLAYIRSVHYLSQVHHWQGRDSNSICHGRTHSHKAPREATRHRDRWVTGVSREANLQEADYGCLHQGTDRLNVRECTPLQVTQTLMGMCRILTGVCFFSINNPDANTVQDTDVVNITRTTAFPTVLK